MEMNDEVRTLRQEHKAMALVDYAKRLRMNVDVIVGALEANDVLLVAQGIINLHDYTSPTNQSGILMVFLAHDNGVSTSEIGSCQDRFNEAMYELGFPRPDEVEVSYLQEQTRLDQAMGDA